jgi:cation/acetate symporter
LAIGLAILIGPAVNVAFLVGLAFAVAASANLPVIVLSIFWKRFTTAGAVTGLLVGLLSSILLIAVGPDFMKDPLFPLKNPAIISIPMGFLGAIIGSLFARERTAEALYPELVVRANTGLGAEQATEH